MTLTIAFLTPALLILLLCWLCRDLDAPEDQPLEVRHSRFTQGSFLCSVLTFAAVALLVPLTTGDMEYSPYLALLALLAALIAPFGFLNRIRYGEGGLTIRTFFGRVHELAWRDVTALTTWTEDGALFIRADRKTFWLASASLGCEEFLQYAAQQCGQYGVRPQVPKGPRK